MGKQKLRRRPDRRWRLVSNPVPELAYTYLVYCQRTDEYKLCCPGGFPGRRFPDDVTHWMPLPSRPWIYLEVAKQLPGGGYAGLQETGREVTVTHAKDRLEDLCDTCELWIADCDSDKGLLEYGDGVGKDNVIACDAYRPATPGTGSQFGGDPQEPHDI